MFSLLSSEDTGIHFNNKIIESDSFNILQDEYMYNGGGVGIADLNRDSLPDIILTGNKVKSRIYLNEGNLKFKDITESFINLDSTQWISGVCIVDINADGWNDIYFSSTHSEDSLLRKNQLWINKGTSSNKDIPTFENQAEKYGIADMGHSVQSVFFDADLDGDLDLYVLNNIVNQHVSTNYRPKITDGTAVNNDHFYINNGDFTFSEKTKEAGIVYEGYGLGIAIGDVNKDGYPDLYISNDYIANDLLYINQKDGTFINKADDLLSYQSKFSMGNDMADVNNDNLLDIITLDMLPEDYFRKKQTINGNSYFFYVNDEKYGYQHQYVRNMLHMHSGFLHGDLLPYQEVGQVLGIHQTEWSWSPLNADYDNDGDKDLIITNGFPKDLTDKDFTNYKANMHGYLLGDMDIISQIPIVKVPNYVYENKDTKQYVDVTKEWGMAIPSFSNGAAYADLDLDGDLDYVCNNINEEAYVFRNNTISSPANNYLRVKLNGSDQNIQAIGAKVYLFNDRKTQYQEKNLVRGYISSVEPILHFGLGKQNSIDSLIVVWPDKNQSNTIKRNIPANQTISIDQKEVFAASTINNHLIDFNNDPLFIKIDVNLEYKHTQLDFIDFFQYQKLIPHKYSQLGPCIDIGDINNDGHEDIVIGGTNDSPAKLIWGSNTGWEDEINLYEDYEIVASSISIVDIDNDDDLDIIQVAGGYEYNDKNHYQHLLIRNNNNIFVPERLPIPPFIAGALTCNDIDKDGDLDIFIGQRIIRDSFPLSGASYLLLNQDGKFTSASSKHYDLGMVSGCSLSDYDNDGDDDLIMTREWNNILVLQNDNGTLNTIDKSTFGNEKGLWRAITAHDMDNDGDDDYIVGNLGSNHGIKISEKNPMRVYYSDIDGNGYIDPIRSAYWTNKKGKWHEYPINFWDEMAAQSPFFRQRFNSYTHFSKATIDSIYTDQVDHLLVNNDKSGIFWNEGGIMAWEELPFEVQFSTVNNIQAEDFNNDDIPDLMIVGNDYGFDVSTGYFDANKGLVLLGKGNKKFEVLRPHESGIFLSGQIESIVPYQQNGEKYYLFGVNRSESQIYKLNRKP